MQSQSSTRKPKRKRTRRQKMMTILWVLLSLYCAAFALLATLQRTFMYHPMRGTEAQYLARAPSQNVRPWRDNDGKLIGWKRVREDAAKTSSNDNRVLDARNHRAKYRLLILHGNGGDALMRTYFMDGLGALNNGQNWDFYALEYPGYGWRGENPNQNDIFQAADEAVSQLLREDSRPLFLAGESLGTGVACLLAAKHPQQIGGLLLATPYTSTVDVAQGRFPIFPVGLAMQDRYEAARALKNYRGRVAIVLAGRDVIVPSHYGQKLFDGYNGAKKLWIQPNAGHNSLDYNARAVWWKEVEAFLLDNRVLDSR